MTPPKRYGHDWKLPFLARQGNEDQQPLENQPQAISRISSPPS
jgi:hypothetical protein